MDFVKKLQEMSYKFGWSAFELRQLYAKKKFAGKPPQTLITFDQLQNDVEKLKQEIAVISSKIKKLRYVNDSFQNVIATMRDFTQAILRQSRPDTDPEIDIKINELILMLQETYILMQEVKTKLKDETAAHSKYSIPMEKEINDRLRQYFPSATEQYICDVKSYVLFHEIIIAAKHLIGMLKIFH